MGGYIVAVLHGRNSHCWVILDGFSNGVEGVFVIVFVEETEETPDTGS
jgi:hypothetical protein